MIDVSKWTARRRGKRPPATVAAVGFSCIEVMFHAAHLARLEFSWRDSLQFLSGYTLHGMHVVIHRTRASHNEPTAEGITAPDQPVKAGEGEAFPLRLPVPHAALPILTGGVP
jgi:hypothetical protein